MSEVAAIAVGAAVGFIGGLGLGACMLCLLGCDQWEVGGIIMVHAVLAMIVMGAWTAPALIPRPNE